uniref:F-box domain-containing protein n=1 Tax=Coccolithus braarudii TaxID=221442 RepID=A0A7S0LL87_9EUKA|mmetsp:Transcript_42394/g.90546  ORF Transcript_42394/g.90546 Transcript_42394/m.90546 type:complete len:235 (+) Transcript_42394:312-1016(+)
MARNRRPKAPRSPHPITGDVLASVLALLDRAGLVCASRVCKEWQAAGSSDSLWRALVEEEWANKSFVPSTCRHICAEGDARAALRLSLEAGRATTIDAATLSAQQWWFRFKGAAGRAWTRQDPWWTGVEASRVCFMPDGRVSWMQRFDADVMRWKLSVRGGVSVLRITHDELGTFPGHILVRASDWGFIWLSPWVVYASFPLDRAFDGKEVRDKTLNRSLKAWQWREVDRYNEE